MKRDRLKRPKRHFLKDATTRAREDLQAIDINFNRRDRRPQISRNARLRRSNPENEPLWRLEMRCVGG
jgi:hypothetical protein